MLSREPSSSLRQFWRWRTAPLGRFVRISDKRGLSLGLVVQILDKRLVPDTFFALMYERRGLAQLRAGNRHRVMEVLRRHGRVSQADIARATGLSRSTISTLVLELRTAGLVTEFGDGRSEVSPRRRSAPGGRPPVLLGLDESAGTAVGIDVGHSHVRVGVANLSHEVTAERYREFQVDHDAAGALGAAAAMVGEVLADAGPSAPPASCLDGSVWRPRMRWRAGSGCRSTSTTTPTWGRWPRSTGVPGAGAQRSSTSRRPRESVPASLRQGSSTGVRWAPRARSATPR